jgi:hypothetical protein
MKEIRKEIMDIMLQAQGHARKFNGGHSYLQRKYPLQATDDPLTVTEEVMVALCRHYLKERE